MKIEDLINKGYFPRELPPPFTTNDLATKYTSIKTSLSGTISKEATRCIDFSISKVGLIRKIIKIPNPMHQCQLCEIVSDNWTEIEKIYKTSKFSFSRPKLVGERAANPTKFKEFIRRSFLASYPYVYELKTDISKYYPTIYTHSIPWAIHGKAVAKQKPLDTSLLGNKLDFHLRQTMYGQTIGIPIGPDTSLIISEIIGCKIDELLLSEFPLIKGYRYVDDMYFFFHSYAEAEAVLLRLQAVLKEFELQVNTEKTKIRKIPRGIEPNWIIQLRTFTIRETEIKQYNDLISFFSLAFDLALQLPNEYVLSYAVERVKRIILLSDTNFALLETMLLKTMIAEPSTIKEVFRVLFTNITKIRVKKIERVLIDFILYHCPRKNDYELSWALWIAKTFKINIPTAASKQLSTTNNPISILIILDLVNDGLIEKAELDLTNWLSKLEDQYLLDENWLLAYEVALKKWIGTDYAYINKVPYFKQLLKHKISFYDPNRQIKPIDYISKEVIEADIETEYENTQTEISELIKVELIPDISYDLNEGEDTEEFDHYFNDTDDLDIDYLNYQ